MANTYGDALFELACQENTIDSLYEEAQAVMEAFQENEELGKLLNHPKIDNEEKQKVVKGCFDAFVSKNMTGLLVLMVSKSRYNEITDALEYFCRRVKAHKGIGTAYVTTAAPLSEAQKGKLVRKLLETTDYREFEMVYKVDKALLGGMIIRIGDRVVDSSIQTKLEELTRDLRKIQMG